MFCVIESYKFPESFTKKKLSLHNMTYYKCHDVFTTNLRYMDCYKNQH